MFKLHFAETQGNTESERKFFYNLIIHDLFHNEKEKVYFC